MQRYRDELTIRHLDVDVIALANALSALYPKESEEKRLLTQRSLVRRFEHEVKVIGHQAETRCRFFASARRDRNASSSCSLWNTVTRPLPRLMTW